MSDDLHLKDKQYYIDLYDKFTVDECRRIDLERKKINEGDKKDAPWMGMVYDLKLYFVKGERYSKKHVTIEKWIKRDRNKDERYKNTILDINVNCLNCNLPMKLEHKHFHGHDDEHILFIYLCDKCHKCRGFLENGSEYIPQVPRCPKCQSKLEEKVKRDKKKITYISSCKNCNYCDSWTTENRINEPEVNHNFIKDRQRFCLSEKEGKEYVYSKLQLENITRLMKENENTKETKKITQLTVAQLSDILSNKLAKERYKDLSISNPELGRDLIVGFTVQDNKSSREEYDSKTELKKLLKRVLENTNWKLMSNGLDYKLGILSGRLRGQDDISNSYS